MYSNNLICDILTYINQNLNDRISIDTIEKIFHYNRYYLMKLFKREINMTIINYINSLRIYNSIREIELNPNNSLLNIALNNGFSSLEYFSETFKLITNYSPISFKKFFKNKIDYNTYFKIQSTISNLYSIYNIYPNYISKQKPVGIPVMKLSIFK